MSAPIHIPSAINSSLQRVLPYCAEQLKEWLAKSQNAAPLRDISYALGTPPDFSKPELCLFYMLRYYSAYITEYYYIYHTILKHLPSSIDVTCIGHGSLLDAVSLSIACDEEAKTYHYHGYDITNWAFTLMNQILQLPGSSFTPHITDACSENIFTGNEDCIIFAKSISHFSNSQLSQLGYAMNLTTWNKQKLFVVSSNRTQEHTYSQDAEKIRFFCSLSRTHNIPQNPFYSFSGQNTALSITKEFLWNFFYGLDIPRDPLSFTADIFSYCNSFRSNHKHCDNSCTNTHFRPLLKLMHLNFEIFELTRK